MRLEVLMSCMHQTDYSIVEKSHITGDVLVINQCDRCDSQEVNREQQRIRMISTTERGLSRSRNMAIRYSDRDICLLADDDEIFEENYQDIIIESFRKNPTADIIAFDVKNKITRSSRAGRVGRLGILKLASYQLAFRRTSIIENGIEFDPYMGAGSGNGCGEENKFLRDCLEHGLKIYYVAETIAQLKESNSTWFHGYDEIFFRQRGSATRYMLGLAFSIIYGIYYLIMKRSLYEASISMPQAARALFRGIKDNSIEKQKKRDKNRRDL